MRLYLLHVRMRVFVEASESMLFAITRAVLCVCFNFCMSVIVRVIVLRKRVCVRLIKSEFFVTIVCVCVCMYAFVILAGVSECKKFWASWNLSRHTLGKNKGRGIYLFARKVFLSAFQINLGNSKDSAWTEREENEDEKILLKLARTQARIVIISGKCTAG